MDNKKKSPFEQKRIALIAHDHKKDDLLAWTKFNQEKLSRHILYATGTTGRLLTDLLKIPRVLLNDQITHLSENN